MDEIAAPLCVCVIRNNYNLNRSYGRPM